MSLDEKVHMVLKSLIDEGLIQEVHTSRHAHFVEGGPIPNEVNVLAVLNVTEPEQHRHYVEGLLHDAGFRNVVLSLHGGRITLNDSSEEPTRHIGSDLARENAMRVRERAYFLWEAAGKPEGRLDEHWDRACELVEGESQSPYPPAQSRGHRT